MVRSMTGFGKAEGKIKGGILNIEIKSFNHRFFEFTGRIPNELLIYEEEIKRYIKKKIRRGSINIIFSYTKERVSEKSLTIDQKLAKRYFNLAQELKRRLGLKESLGAKDLLAFPGVIVYEETKEDLSKDWNACRRVLQKAIENLLLAKEREGKDLLKDILMHINQIDRSVRCIKQGADKLIHQYKKRFRRRLKEILGKEPVQGRLEEEAILFVRNSDVSEEIIRMKSHIDNFHRLLKAKEDVGRRFDFIAQELYREANTIGAKGNDYIISKEVVEMKSAIEKIREQAQNIE